jgi:hypothetical protein
LPKASIDASGDQVVTVGSAAPAACTVPGSQVSFTVCVAWACFATSCALSTPRTHAARAPQVVAARTAQVKHQPELPPNSVDGKTKPVERCSPHRAAMSGAYLR